MGSIRPVDRGDVLALASLLSESFDPRFGEAWSVDQCLSALALPGCALRVADSDGALAGFSLFRWLLDESELLLVGVDPNYRRRGIGAQLLDDWMKSVRGHGVHRLFLEMRADNDAAHLYERYGFERCGLRPNYYKGNDGVTRDAITMQLLL